MRAWISGRAGVVYGRVRMGLSVVKRVAAEAGQMWRVLWAADSAVELWKWS